MKSRAQSVGPAEEQGGAVGRGDRGEVGLAGRAVARQARREQRLGALGGADRVGALDRDRGDPRRLARRLVVDEDACLAVAPQLHRLGAVLPGVAEAHRDQQPLEARRPLRRDRQLGERVAAQRRGRRELVLEQQQRAHGVDRHPARVGLAEDVVEHLERERALIARRQHVAEEPREVEAALAREAAVVAAPLEHVHDQLGRVGELEEEDLRGRDVADPARVGAAREDVEGVEAGAEVRVVAGLRDPPRVVVVAHVAPPRERLVGDSDPPPSAALGQLAQLRGGERVVVDRVRRDVRAHQHGVRAELLHDRELRLRAPQVGGEALLGHRLEVAQRLVERDLQPERLAARADLGRRVRRGDQVRLEQLDRVEARRRGGRQLLLERAAQADSGDRAAHSSSTWASMRSRSGRAPVNSSSEPAACSATIAPPSSVRQPRSSASCRSWVRSGM